MLAALYLTALIAVTVASPVVVPKSPITLPLARRLHAASRASNLAHADQARAKAFRNRTVHSPADVAGASVIPVPISNAVLSYGVEVQVGEPPTTYNLIVDTGSANTWVGANTDRPFVPSQTSVDTGDLVLAEYGSGLFVGEEFFDTITIGGSLTIPNQSIGTAEVTLGNFAGFDGIMGIGPVDITNGTIVGTTQTVPTVTDNANALGLLDSFEVGIFFQPATSASDTGSGELTFGGVDTSKFIGPLNRVPITSTTPANEFVGINQTVTYGSSNLPILDNSAGVADTGTTLILLATDALERYQAATGATLDSNTTLLTITPENYDNLDSLFFQIGGETYEFTKNAQTWPRALNSVIDGEPNSIYLIVNDIGTLGGTGLDFINGFSFLERFYTVYDTGSNQFGIAKTASTFATTN